MCTQVNNEEANRFWQNQVRASCSSNGCISSIHAGSTLTPRFKGNNPVHCHMWVNEIWMLSVEWIVRTQLNHWSAIPAKITRNLFYINVFYIQQGCWSTDLSGNIISHSACNTITGIGALCVSWNLIIDGLCPCFSSLSKIFCLIKKKNVECFKN